MPKAIFLYNGGNYKIDIDDGRVRVPQNYQEAESIFIDNQLSDQDMGNSHGAELNMSHFANLFCDLAADDEIFFGILPDAAFYRAIWVHMYNKVDGFVADFDLVSIKDVYEAHLKGDATGVPAFAGTEVQEADFTDGVCNATKDAVLLAKQWDKDADQWEKYRNNDGQVATAFDPVFAGLGQSLYLRMTVKELGNLGDSAEATCSKCRRDSYPFFKAGAILDVTCGDKQRVTSACCGLDSPCATRCD